MHWEEKIQNVAMTTYITLQITILLIYNNTIMSIAIGTGTVIVGNHLAEL